MYSATYNDEVIQLASNFVGSFTPYTIKKEALKLKGVRNFRIILSEAEKLEFMARFHTELYKTMTMVFVNTKKNATMLQEKLATKGVKSNILIGGMENKDRDQIIDDFRKQRF
jgi:superfamily II DNA/RNA helicase